MTTTPTIPSEPERAEHGLGRSDESVRALVDAAFDGVILADRDGRFVEVNAALCAMLGCQRDDLVGKKALDVVACDDLPRVAAADEELLRTRAHAGAWALRANDGASVPVEVRAKLLGTGERHAVVRDLRPRRDLEDALRASEERFARAQRAAHLGAWEWNLATNEVWRSAEFFAIFGVPADTAHARPFSFTQHLPEEDLVALRAAIDRAAATNTRYELEHRVRRADGEERWVVQRGEMLSEAGQPPRMVGTMLDITDRKRAEREREVVAGRLRAVLEQAPIGIVIFEGDDRIVPNERAVALLGRTADPTKGAEQSVGFIMTSDEKIVSKEDLPGMRALRGERVEVELVVRTPAGGTVPVLVTAGPIHGEDGSIQGSVVAFEDISSLKALERLRIEWSSIVAHDLRQPLNTIALAGRLLARRFASSPDDLESIEQILRSGKRIDTMVNDLMDMSLLEVRRVRLARQPGDLGRIVRSCASRLVLEGHGRDVRVHVDDPLPLAAIDADRITQVLDNLTSNAVKYGRPGTPIAIEARVDGRAVAVSVRNEGDGIAAEDLPHVFDRFHRARSAKRGPVKGLGLGLYIVRSLVEAHGGGVSVESEPDGVTTFRFTVPIVADAAPASAGRR